MSCARSDPNPPIALGGETVMDDGAATALALLLDRKIASLGADFTNTELIDATLIEAMAIVPGTVEQVRRRLLSVAPFRRAAKPARRRR